MSDDSKKAILMGIPTNEKRTIEIGNVMAQGNYPTGLDGCFVVGMQGGCGLDCYVYQNGDCEDYDGFEFSMSPSELKQHIAIYGEDG